LLFLDPVKNQSTYRIYGPPGKIKGKLRLSSSKSISNRLLIIKQVGNPGLKILNPASSKDTQTLQAILSAMDSGKIFDVGHAGTAMRFLTALFAAMEGERILTGSDRMKERPIAELVDALRQLGADITYLEKEGFPPLQIKGKKLGGGKLRVNGSISSQYISALLMIAPLLNDKLEIELQGKAVSKPYIEMTVKLMQEFGADVHWSGNELSCSNKSYHTTEKEYKVEADWSSASYLYSILALSQPGSELQIEGLKAQSIQADAVCKTIFASLGVESEFGADSLLQLRKTGHPAASDFAYDFSDCPDIAQTLAVTTALLGMNGTLDGLQTLKIKETDRILALHDELKKAGIQTSITGHSIHFKCSAFRKIPEAAFDTYHDHRMALAFAPMSMVTEYVDINDPAVIEKSYPEYWDHLRQLGFRIESVFSL
jgi:3-phosphoshikimate 1-carboxyvinyltransferase